MIRSIIIDDEVNAIGVITEYLKNIPDVELVRSFTDPTEALNYIASAEQKPELVFLDIQMSRLNGLTLAGHLPPQSRIVLTTAYPDFALQGYELDVIDYLLKPFSFERFERAIQKARNILRQASPESSGQPAKRLVPGSDDFIFVRTDYKTLKVRLADILYIEGSGNYVTLHTLKGKILVLQNLKNFEEQLLPYQFIRTHKSFIVSLKHIDVIEKGWVRIGDQEIPIGDSMRESFNRFLKENYPQF